MKTFLFQGDSITDCGRDRNNDKNLGLGYPFLFASDYSLKFPYEYNFINKGVSGDRIVDVYARIKRDIINIRPDYMSLLIGVNDVWHEVSYRNGVDAPKFEMIYSMLIEEITAALPEIKIFLLEPFVLQGTATTEAWGYFKEETKLRAEAVKRIADKYGLTFIPLQEKFNNSVKSQNTAYWLVDGVHPAPAGHALIKEALSEEFDKTEK